MVYLTAVLVIIEGSGMACASGVFHYNTSTVVSKTLKKRPTKKNSRRVGTMTSDLKLKSLLKTEVRQVGEVNSVRNKYVA